MCELLEELFTVDARLDKELDRLTLSEETWAFIEKQGPESPIFVAGPPIPDSINTLQFFNVGQILRVPGLTEEEKKMAIVQDSLKNGKRYFVTKCGEDITRCEWCLTAFNRIF
ncbi:hypothetical protein RF11_00287 [Thelohanellus kitauei]|uniref:Uncharacterized protein n=1 Tax=Thelohanellus kitauei TaxID=669202 RepID=A0A0C2MN26_THEKT|nr:hypothetical protein RF11_00287 [Thelohanellus kitauei]